ncbi:putative WD repeat-containing protein alr2800 [Oculina patagonica]
MVPHFTGRKRECDEIISQVTSKSTRIVSVWGSPGFGKTSVAIAVGHHLQSFGLPVCFLSLRGLKSKSDLTSKFLGLLRQFLPFSNDQPSQQLSLDDELCQMFCGISDSLVCILDNADDLLESGAPNVKDEVIDLLEEILRSNEKVTFLVISRESFEFMDVRFEGHQTSRIRQLEAHFSQELVQTLLPMAGIVDCKKISQLCGDIPLAIKLLCSSLSEDNPIPLSQVLKDYLETSDEIIQMLDNPDYPSSLRLQVLFDTSFQRLSEEERKALVSLTILPENFDMKIAAAVLGVENTAKTNKILQRLRRKSLLDLASKTGSFSIHKLLHLFSREKGEQEMKDTILSAKSRFCAYYIALFKSLNEKYLAGHSMSAFTEFYNAKPSTIQSLVESCSDPNVAEEAFEVLATAEHFLDLLLWREGHSFVKMYDSALEESCKKGRNRSYRKLLVSKAFSEIT